MIHNHSIIITCEYAGNQVPVRYQSVFDNEKILNSSLGWDAGALDIAVEVSESLNIPCFVHHTTRLLVDVDRSIESASVFSKHSQVLDDQNKQLLLDKYYFPYRLRIENAIATTVNPVLHLSIHTFSTVGNNEEPSTDIKLLFDLERMLENKLSLKLLNGLNQHLPDFKIYVNEHHRQDNFIRYLRTRFSDEEYAGFRIEINQKFAEGNSMEIIVWAIREALLSILN